MRIDSYETLLTWQSVRCFLMHLLCVGCVGKPNCFFVKVTKKTSLFILCNLVEGDIRSTVNRRGEKNPPTKRKHKPLGNQEFKSLQLLQAQLPCSSGRPAFSQQRYGCPLLESNPRSSSLDYFCLLSFHAISEQTLKQGLTPKPRAFLCWKSCYFYCIVVAQPEQSLKR